MKHSLVTTLLVAALAVGASGCASKDSRSGSKKSDSLSERMREDEARRKDRCQRYGVECRPGERPADRGSPSLPGVGLPDPAAVPLLR